MSTFYVVSTPIGNMEDITLRALKILEEVQIILCEDTRVTRKLLSKYDIGTETMSYHAHSDDAKMNIIYEKLAAGQNMAIVTDAGTPTISDPGSFLISKIRSNSPETKIVSVPGPSALTAALSISGVNADEFIFLGFLPHKKGRETLFKEIKVSERTIVFYESTHRIMKTLESLKEMDKIVTIVREITKIYEEVISGLPEDVMSVFEQTPEKRKGEFVVIVSAK